MSSVAYSLKSGVNRTNNPSIGGVFSYGRYTSAGVFTLFDNYEYSDGTPFVAEPFDSTKVLSWKGDDEFPHLGFENLSPNSNITPQPFPTFGIYLHPHVTSGVREDVGVRVIIPFSGNISIQTLIQKADLVCGDGIGYRIIRNGVAIQSRQYIEPSATPLSINTPLNYFSAGDVIDFIVDSGTIYNFTCDDVMLEITLTYQYNKIPSPVVDVTSILCSTTSISGTTAYVADGTRASIYDGTTLLYSTGVSLNNTLYNGSFSFTGLDFTNSLGKNLYITLEKSGDVNSDPIYFTIQDGGCIEVVLSTPIVTEVDFCHKRCEFKRAMTGSASNDGEIVIFEYPYNYGDDIIAAAVSLNRTWYVNSENFKEGKKYVAFLINYEGSEGETVEIESINCEAICDSVPILKGTVVGVSNGLIRVFLSPIVGFQLPVVIGVIKDGRFNIKTDLLSTGVDYILQVTKIN